MVFLKLQGSEVFCRNTTVAIIKLLVPSTGLTVKYWLFLSPGGYQWYHISPGPADGKAVCWRRLPHRFPCGGTVSGRHWHQRRTWTDLLQSDRNTQRAQQSGPGLFIHWNKTNQLLCGCRLTTDFRKLLTWHVEANTSCIVLYYRSGFFLFSVHHPLVRFTPLNTPSFLLSVLLLSLHHSFIHLLIQEVHRGFPDAKFTPTYAVVATWEHVAPYEEQSRTTGPSNKVRWMEGLRALAPGLPVCVMIYKRVSSLYHHVNSPL